MAVTPADFKRQILQESDKSPIRERIQNNLAGISDDERVKIGAEVEKVTQMPGFAYIDAFMVKRSMMAFNDFMAGKTDPIVQGTAKGMQELMHYIDQTIKMKNEILAKRAREDREDGVA